MLGEPPNPGADSIAFVVMRLGLMLAVLGIALLAGVSLLNRASVMGPEKRFEARRLRRAKEDPLDRVYEAMRASDLRTGA